MAAKLTLATVRDGPQKHIDIVRDLGQQEYAEYAKSAARIIHFVDEQQQFDMARESFGEYKILVDDYAKKYATKPQLNHAIQAEISNRLNRSLRNFFSEYRSFLDYTEVYLKNEYEDASQEFKAFKVACAREYDSSLSYRFVYKLRSYAQHSAVPINNIVIEAGDFDPTLGDYRHHLRLETDRDTLLHIRTS